MRMSRRWLAGTAIAAVAIGGILFLGGLAYAHWGEGQIWGVPGPGYGPVGCHMMWDGNDDDHRGGRGGYASFSPKRVGPSDEDTPAGYDLARECYW